ncbi:hypothetical protein NBRC10513v2_004412 [Rhodotorula toruloides]
MDGFSRADRIRAICAPLCCCWSSRVALSSPSTESLSDWFGQSRPSNSPGNGADLADTWQNAGKTDRRRDADVLSLHEGVGTGGLGQRRRFRPRGGDISGGGADTGSGLTRWTLLKSWWWGGSGAIRLTDSEDEGEELDDGEAEGVGQRDGDVVHAHEGDADAPLVTLDDVDLPPAPPSGAPEPSASSVASSSASPNLSEGTTLVDTDEDREARRAHRRARRRARELGISLEEFEQGVAPSSSTISTGTSSSRRSRRRRGEHYQHDQASPLHNPTSGDIQYYEDENGQLVAYVAEASYGGEQAAEPTSPAPPVSSSYDHIGVLPGISSRASEAGEM